MLSSPSPFSVELILVSQVHILFYSEMAKISVE